jgi:putative DNA primase/helicase
MSRAEPRRRERPREQTGSRQHTPSSGGNGAVCVVESPIILDPRDPLPSARKLIEKEYTARGSRVLHRHRGAFYHWNGSRYEEIDVETIRSALWRFLEVAKRLEKREIVTAFQPTRNKVADVLSALEAVANIVSNREAPFWLMNDGSLPPACEMFPVANGLIHLPEGVLFDPSPDYLNLHGADWSYDPDAPEPAEWLRFLKTIWPDDDEAISTLQDWIGYCLGPDTDQQKILMMVGPPRSGKGTIARILTSLLGQNSVAAPTLNALGSNFGLAPLIGKPLAIISDARLGYRSDHASIAERLLSVSGEDSITIDRKYQSAWTGRLSTRFMLLTNELPRLSDASGALARRFVMLVMTASFLGREDHGLESKLLAELPGIFLWAREGWQRLRVRGFFEQPASSCDAIEDLLVLASPVTAFVKEICSVGVGHEEKVDALFDAWESWCEANGRKDVGTKQSFGQQLRAACPSLTTPQRKSAGKTFRVFQGIGIS